MTTAPCEVWFYHLEQTALDQALPDLLEKTLAKGWKAVVRTTASERLEHLDGWLWSYRDDSFLPHGVDTEPLAERQPILLTAGMELPNSAQAVFLVDGAEPGDLDGVERCVVLFDGRDDAALAHARRQWSAIKARGLGVSYWRQQGRKWEKQA